MGPSSGGSLVTGTTGLDVLNIAQSSQFHGEKG